VAEIEVISVDWESVPMYVKSSGTFTLMLGDATEASFGGSRTLT
jgi:hypothetical protein